MKKTFIALLAAVLAAGTATIASAAYVDTTQRLTAGEITSANYPGSLATGLPEVTTGQLLKGKIICGTLVDTETALTLFDGDPNTSYNIGGANTWVGIELDQAYELTEIRYAPNPSATAGWFDVQGSNDGVNWVNIIVMRQDAHGTDYHIFTPQTVTDQRYIDAGYSNRSDESIHWLAKGGSYSMYRITSDLVGDVEFYGNPAPATELTEEIASTINISTPYYYPHNIHIRTNDEVKNSVDGSLVGTIIAGGGVWNKALYARAFDGNNKTYYDPCILGPECWVGMMFDEPHALTEVRILPKRGCQVDISYGHFQGSLDGVNWVDLATFTEEDVPATQDWVIKEITDPKGYTYFRYVSAEHYQSSLAELLIFGAPAEAAEPFTVDPLIATKNVFTGEIYYSDTKNVVADGEISGTPICYLYHRGGWYSDGNDSALIHAFDNNTATGFQNSPRQTGAHVWIGLAADEPTVAGKVAVCKPNVLVTDPQNLYIQGSNDGVNWTTLTVYNATVDTLDENAWWTAEITDPNSYTFFRAMTSPLDFPGCDVWLYEFRIYPAASTAVETTAPETTAPETTAPETTAPETTAPETTAPETTAPETTAPETTAPEVTAPQTFDFGVAAAVAAVVSAAGYAFTKKRK